MKDWGGSPNDEAYSSNQIEVIDNKELAEELCR